MTHRALISAVFVLAAAFYFQTSYGETDPCSVFADLKSQDTSVFVGFGVGSSQRDADKNAKVDLASHIHEKVSAEESVTSDNATQSIESSSSTSTSEDLLGTRFLKRCHTEDSFSAVAVLDKQIFLKRLNDKCTILIARAKQFTRELDKLKKGTPAKMLKIVEAQKFLAQNKATVQADLEMCRTYDGCTKIEDAEVQIFEHLADEVSTMGEESQYVLVAKENATTKNFADEAIELLQKSGIAVRKDTRNSKEDFVADSNVNSNSDLGPDSDFSSDSAAKIALFCSSKKGSKIPNSKDRVVEVKCVAEGYIGKQSTFRKTYTCQAMASASEKASDVENTCIGRLEESLTN